MQYYVIGPDGNKYGPADVPTLKQWITENRLTPQSMLEDFNTGQRMPASAVPGLFDAAQTATAPGPNMGPAAGTMYSQVPTPGAPGYYNPQAAGDNGKTWIIWSWVCSGVGLTGCCFFIFSILGIVFAFIGKSKGYANAMAPIIFGFASLAIGIVVNIMSRAFLMEFVRQMQQQSR